MKAKEIDSDVLITFDADGQHRITDINSVLLPIKDGISDIVIGSRFLDYKSEDMPEYRKLGIKMITEITNLSIKEKLTDFAISTGVNILDKTPDILAKSVKNIADWASGFKVETDSAE